MESIPYVDLFARPTAVMEAQRRALLQVLESGPFIGGSEVENFEREWAEYLGVEHCVGVANGLDAMTLALRALRVGPGDYVAVPAHTFIATWLAVIHAGATPVGVDCDARGQMDLNQLEQLNPLPKAAIVVHMHGLTGDIERIANWARSKGVLLVEDCAQAHGGAINGRRLGSYGNVAAFSFYPTKNLGAFGDAGALVTNDPGVASVARSLANYGSSPNNRYDHRVLGVNSRLDPVQAAVLRAGLPFLDEQNEERRKAAAAYLNLLQSGTERVSVLETEPDRSIWHHFVVEVTNRDEIRESLLNEERVSTEIHYPRVAAYEASALQGVTSPRFPVAETLSSRTLSLPLFPGITLNQIERVVDSLLAVAARLQ